MTRYRLFKNRERNTTIVYDKDEKRIVIHELVETACIIEDTDEAPKTKVLGGIILGKRDHTYPEQQQIFGDLIRINKAQREYEEGYAEMQQGHADDYIYTQE